MALPALAQSQSDADRCKARKQELASVIEHTNSKPPVAQFKELIQFLDAIEDDPTDCVSSAATDQIRKAERHLIALEVGRQTLEPDWVFHCNEVDKRSAWCTGQELDVSAQLPEEGFGTRVALASPAHPRSAKLGIQDGYSCKVIGIYGSSSTALQAGKPVVPLAHHQMAIEIGKLPAKNPVLIVTLRCEDKLRYRKAVWHLY
jgi:hypothetical protein